MTPRQIAADNEDTRPGEAGPPCPLGRDASDHLGTRGLRPPPRLAPPPPGPGARGSAGPGPAALPEKLPAGSGRPSGDKEPREPGPAARRQAWFLRSPRTHSTQREERTAEPGVMERPCAHPHVRSPPEDTGAVKTQSALARLSPCAQHVAGRTRVLGTRGSGDLTSSPGAEPEASGHLPTCSAREYASGDNYRTLHTKTLPTQTLNTADPEHCRPCPLQTLPTADPAHCRPCPLQTLPTADPAHCRPRPLQTLPTADPAPAQTLTTADPAHCRPCPLQTPPTADPAPYRPRPLQTLPTADPAPAQTPPTADPAHCRPCTSTDPAHCRPCPLQTLPPTDPAHSRPCPLQTPPTADPAHCRPCPLQTLPTADPAHCRPCPLRTLHQHRPCPLQTLPTADPAHCRPCPLQTLPTADPAPAQTLPTADPAPAQTLPTADPAHCRPCPLQNLPTAEPATAKPGLQNKHMHVGTHPRLLTLSLGDSVFAGAAFQPAIRPLPSRKSLWSRVCATASRASVPPDSERSLRHSSSEAPRLAPVAFAPLRESHSDPRLTSRHEEPRARAGDGQGIQRFGPRATAGFLTPTGSEQQLAPGPPLCREEEASVPDFRAAPAEGQPGRGRGPGRRGEPEPPGTERAFVGRREGQTLPFEIA
ncbi:proline-rich protein 36-like [Perognathus longimembris pacificus]|uniref:proline-rich protein 36-like n=1 Tax=Perognathus longimembris pacificus TaxID=214514 RepID=UPI002019DBB3|nr:proline-rich protein 36-like [Perognathus longimembris pacificus]